MERFAPFLLDRLSDASPHDERETTAPTLTLKELKDSVAEDLEALLNTRCALPAADVQAHRRAARTILRFGLDDFSARSLAGADDRDFICRAIERAVREQEPRLDQVQVELDVRGAHQRELRFVISALLRLHPAAEPVNFDAVLQTGVGQYVVKSARPLRQPGIDANAAI